MRKSTECFRLFSGKQGSWGGRGGGGGGVVVGSPGVGGTSNSSSSSGASWRSGTPSPPLSDEGAPTTGSLWPTSAHPSHNQQHYPYNASGSSSSSTPGSTTTLDEGIVPDYLEEQHPRKKKVSGSLCQPRATRVSSIDRSIDRRINPRRVCMQPVQFLLSSPIKSSAPCCNSLQSGQPMTMHLAFALPRQLSFYCRDDELLAHVACTYVYTWYYC